MRMPGKQENVKIILIWLLFIIFFMPLNASAEISFKEVSLGVKDLDILALAVSKTNPNLAYIGSRSTVYKTQDGGKTWRTALNLRGLNKGVNFISFNRSDPGIVYLATEGGLLVGKENGRDDVWVKIFSGIGNTETGCLCVLADKTSIFLGTQAGLFISYDSGQSWQKARGELGAFPVYSLEKSADLIYASGRNKLFISSDLGKNWHKAFSFGLHKDNLQEENSAFSDTSNDIDAALADDGKEVIRLFMLEQGGLSRLYLVSSSGIFISIDSGVSFSALTSAGLAVLDISCIAADDSNNVYVCGRSGLFVLADGQEVWRSLYQGIISSNIRLLGIDSLSRIWLATDRGVLRAVHPYIEAGDGIKKADNWRLYFKDEPTIAEIHSAAIKYAEVIDPQRIENLRKGARLKALVPDVSLDYDHTINFSSANYYVGPQDWSLGFSWDLADLIWSDQQRLIDSQVRLMVELREDILAELTRLYFERRRLQAELLISPPQEPQTMIEKELRLEELTASIDALTGGYLSRESYQARPN